MRHDTTLCWMRMLQVRGLSSAVPVYCLVQVEIELLLGQQLQLLPLEVRWLPVPAARDRGQQLASLHAMLAGLGSGWRG